MWPNSAGANAHNAFGFTQGHRVVIAFSRRVAQLLDVDMAHQTHTEMDTTQTTVSRLYSPRQVSLAAFIGSPVAACWCLSRNYRQLGNSGAAQKWWIWGGSGSFVFLVFACMFPSAQHFPRIIIPLAYSLAFQELTKRIQGDAVTQHISAGGRLASWWFVVGISLLFLIGVFGLLVVALYFLLS